MKEFLGIIDRDHCSHFWVDLHFMHDLDKFTFQIANILENFSLKIYSSYPFYSNGIPIGVWCTIHQPTTVSIRPFQGWDTGSIIKSLIRKSRMGNRNFWTKKGVSQAKAQIFLHKWLYDQKITIIRLTSFPLQLKRWGRLFLSSLRRGFFDVVM